MVKSLDGSKEAIFLFGLPCAQALQFLSVRLGEQAWTQKVFLALLL